MARANDWAVEKYQEWGIEARKEQYGTWRGWERGISHLDLVSPRVRSLEGMAAAWSPATDGPVEAGVVILADADSPEAFEAWLPAVRGKFVLISRPESSCRPRDNLEWFARPETLARMTEERERAVEEWSKREESAGIERRELPEALDLAGAAGIIRSQWSEGWGVNKIFGTGMERTPLLDLSCESYGLVYRLAENGQEPVLRVDAQARFLGEVPVFNAIAEIPGAAARSGAAEPDQYVILGGHYDSWDGSSGALDNGTGAVAIMEAMRILKKAVPNPRRTIIGALWNGEEQGMNGSRAFVEDHPEILERTHTVFNVDHGAGPVTFIPMQGFAAAGGASASGWRRSRASCRIWSRSRFRGCRKPAARTTRPSCARGCRHSASTWERAGAATSPWVTTAGTPASTPGTPTATASTRSSSRTCGTTR